MDETGNCEFQLISIADLELDTENPRIAKWIEMYGENPSSEEIALALGAGTGQDGDGGPSYFVLKQSILTNKGIIHPIIVNRNKKSNLVVIEGNTRTQIYREFDETKIAGDWSRIPAMIYDNLSDEEIDAIRLQAHLVGVRQWDPYSKAKYLNHLFEKKHLSLSQITDFCGGNKREVTNFIQAYNDMETFYTPTLESDQDFDPTRFSAFVELQSSRVIEALIRAGYTKSDFSEWVHERKLFPLNTVRKLPKILHNEKSRKEFLKSGAQNAVKLLDVPETESVLQDAPIHHLARELYRKINEFKYEDLERLRKEPHSDEVEILLDTRDALNSFCEDLSSVEE
jgi:hypothetical protein